MKVVEQFPLVHMPDLTECPSHQMVVVSISGDKLECDSRGEDGDTLCRWVYGPGTVNPWPQGDYCSGRTYIEPAFADYVALSRDVDYHTFFAIDPEFLMDIGL